MGIPAVTITQPDGQSYVGTLLANPKVGMDCRLLVKGDLIRLDKIRGWIGLVGSNSFFIFDAHGNKYRMTTQVSL